MQNRAAQYHHNHLDFEDNLEILARDYHAMSFYCFGAQDIAHPHALKNISAGHTIFYRV